MSLSHPDQLQSPEVICFGEALVDRLGPLGGDPACDRPVEDCLGGAPANVACALARLGKSVAFIGRLGNDVIGERFRLLMTERGVNLKGLQIDLKLPSRIVLVRRDVNGERSFQNFAGNKGEGFADQALDINPVRDNWPLLARKASWLLIGTIPLATYASAEALKWCVEEASRTDIKIALDINWRPTFWDSSSSSHLGPSDHSREVISSLLEKASLLKLAKEEANWFFGHSDPCKISSSLPQKPDVVVTDGAQPVLWSIQSFVGEMKVFSPEFVVDTTGAGDAFTAGLLKKLLEVSPKLMNDQKAYEIVRFASACGALVCGGMGGIDPQPTNNQVTEFISALSG